MLSNWLLISHRQPSMQLNGQIRSCRYGYHSKYLIVNHIFSRQRNPPPLPKQLGTKLYTRKNVPSFLLMFGKDCFEDHRFRRREEFKVASLAHETRHAYCELNIQMLEGIPADVF